MSFSDAIGQIDQIIQWEQQLTNGSALSPATSSAGSTASTAGSDATGGVGLTASGTTATSNGASTGSAATFASALAQAQTSEAASLLSSGNDGSTAGSGSLDPTATSASSLLGGGDSQLLAALSALQSGPSGSTTTATSSSTSGLLSALESALASTATGSTGPATASTGPAAGPATSASDPRIQAMLQEANSLVGQPYVWGGGHGSWAPQTGYDCSGFVSAVLHAGGYLSSPQDTTSLPNAAGIAAGPGQYVTIYDRDGAGEAGHVIIDIAGQFYESGGEQGSWGGGGGIEAIATPPASYLATCNRVLHPQGL